MFGIRSKSKNEIDMLNGSIADKIIIFAIPLALTGMLQQLFNAADIVVCGRFVGSKALAAVGANAQIVNLFVNAFLGLSVGINVMIASYIGEKKNEKIGNVVHTAITFGVVFGLGLMTIGLNYAKDFLTFLGTPIDILDDATTYLKILFIGIPFLVIYNFGAAIVRSIGDTRRPLIILICTGCLNVLLNIFLVMHFNLGVIGVAIATSVSNFVSAIIVIIILMREKSVIKYDIRRWFINIDALLKVLKIGVPCAVQGMVFSISNLCVQTAVNSLGTNTIAANAASVNFESYPYYMVHAFGDACVTFFSQNLGAHKYDRCKKVFKASLLVGLSFSISLTIILQLFASGIIRLFTIDQAVIDIAMVRVRIAGATIWVQCLYDCCGAGLRAMRHPVIPPLVVILGTVLFRIWWCFAIFPMYGTYDVVAVAYPLSWLAIDVVMPIAYIIVSKKVLK